MSNFIMNLFGKGQQVFRWLALLSLLVSCGVANAARPAYIISGNVFGLEGSDLVLQNNGGDDIVIDRGSFVFPTRLNNKAAYNVTVLSNPTNLSQTCTVSNGSGIVDRNSVYDIRVDCITNHYTIGGTVSGLAGSGLKLQNNGGDDLAVTANGSYTFNTSLLDGSAYSVMVQTQPTNPPQVCTVSNAGGTLSGTNVSNVDIDCVTTYTIGGMVSGLTGSEMVLQNNAGDDLAIDANGSFIFSSRITDASSYAVTISTPPTRPLQNCIITGGNGIVSSADITDVDIACVDGDKYYPGHFDSHHIGEERVGEIALGDVDGDGDLDMVTGSSRVAVWLNDGSKDTYKNEPDQDLGPVDTVHSTSDIDLADIDGDGDLDMVVAIYGPNAVWINQGFAQGGKQGVYVDSGQALGDAFTTSVSMGDVDGDGDLDLMAQDFWGSVGSVWFNNGSGQFSDSGQALGELYTYRYETALGDMDGDGDLDLIEATGTDNGIILWINQGGAQGGTPGFFVDSGQALGIGDTRSVVLGDVDADGDLDVVGGHWGANSVWLNNGSGGLIYSGQGLGNADTSSITLGDMDGDGDLDIVSGNDWGQPNALWLNNGFGNFTDSGQVMKSSVFTLEVAVGDVDGDGDQDIMEAYYNGVMKWLNEGSAIFPDSLQHLGKEASEAIALGDIDNDGDLDMVVGNGLEQANSVWLNDGAGNYSDTPVQTMDSLTDTYDIALGDLNGDGSLDVVATDFRGKAKIRFNDGNGVFINPKLWGGYNVSVSLADLDGDGDLDIIEGRTISNIIWFNDGAGNFTDSGQRLGNDWTYKIAVGDVDGDGDADLVFAESATADTVWLNDGSGHFTDSDQRLGLDHLTHAAELGDLDGDGDLDLVLGYSTASVFPNRADAVWINQGGAQGGAEGLFVDSGQALDTESTQKVAMGDIDNDGDLDLVFAHFSADNVWLNDGSANFSRSEQSLGNHSTYDLTLGDIDGDNDLDVVTATIQSGNLVYKNMTFWPYQ